MKKDNIYHYISIACANIPLTYFYFRNCQCRDNENKAPTRIEFCEMGFILDYEYYSGIYLDSNRDVYSFAIDNVTENWNLYGNYSETPIKLTDLMPQGGLLDYLSEHQECCNLIGKISLEDYDDYKNELEQIDFKC